MDDLLAEFLTETNEALDVTDVELVKLEQEPDNPDILGNIFRLVHTIKGTSGFLGLPRLETVAHAGEDVLGKIRDGEIEDVITLVLEALDRIKEIVQGLGELETEPEGDDTEIVARLREMAANADAASAAAAPAEPAAAEAAKSDFEDIKANELDELEAAFNAAPGPADAAADPDPEPEPEPEPQPSKEVVAKGSAAVAKKKEAVPAKAGESSTANQTIRVSVDLLATLMITVSELVLTRNQLMQLCIAPGSLDTSLSHAAGLSDIAVCHA